MDLWLSPDVNDVIIGIINITNTATISLDNEKYRKKSYWKDFNIS